MKRADASLAACIGGALILVAATQLQARRMAERVRESSDAYLLPPPQFLVKMSLGHRAALADVLWAKLLVSEGLRLSDRRRFDVAVEYLDAIIELDPKWRDPYRMSDSLVTLQAKEPPLDQVYAVRRILERGVEERPFDAELWLVLGQFVGQIAPGTFFEHDPVEAERWRTDGAVALARAAELAPADSGIVWQAMSGARVFLKHGRKDRAIEMYATILSTSEDPELRARIEQNLASISGQSGAEEAIATQARKEVFDDLRLKHYPGLRRGPSAIVGPPRDPAACAGGARSVGTTAKCATSWRRWGELDPVGTTADTTP